MLVTDTGKKVLTKCPKHDFQQPARGRFAGLSERLLRAGVGPRRVRRLVSELEAHFDDLVAELQSTGLSRSESESQAAVRLGTEDVLAASIITRPELRSWARRWPW